MTSWCFMTLLLSAEFEAQFVLRPSIKQYIQIPCHPCPPSSDRLNSHYAGDFGESGSEPSPPPNRTDARAKLSGSFGLGRLRAEELRLWDNAILSMISGIGPSSECRRWGALWDTRPRISCSSSQLLQDNGCKMQWECGSRIQSASSTFVAC